MKNIGELNVGDVCFVRAMVCDVKKDTMTFHTIDENEKLLMEWSFALCDSEYGSVLTADDLQQECRTESVKQKFPWEKDAAGLPVLDSKEKLEAYVRAWLHRPVDWSKLDFTPVSLESVELSYGTPPDVMLQRAMRAMDVCVTSMPLRDAFNDLVEKHVKLGVVNGVAADVLNSMREQDRLEKV